MVSSDSLALEQVKQLVKDWPTKPVNRALLNGGAVQFFNTNNGYLLTISGAASFVDAVILYLQGLGHGLLKQDASGASFLLERPA